MLLYFLFPHDAFTSPNIKRICAAKNGANTIYWIPFADTCQDLEITYIYARENVFAGFKIIDSTINANQFIYEHTNAATFQRGSYFLAYKINCGGIVKIIYSDTIAVDVEAPPVMDPDSISVGADGEIFIGWKQSSVADAKSYIIYHTVGASNFPIDTVYGRSNTFYTDKKNGDAGTKSEGYKIAPTDSCNNVAPIGQYHQTIFLSASQEFCASVVNLKWSSYLGWKKNAETDGILKYTIYASPEKYFNYKKIGETAGNNFTIDNLKNHEQYYFFVRAVNDVDSTITSSSNRISLVTNFEDSTRLLYLANVSFLKNTNHLEVKWAVDTNHNYVYFDLKRGKTPAQLNSIAKIPATSSRLYSFTEMEPDSNFVWYYKINGYSACGKLLGQSNISKDIKLHLKVNSTSRILRWTNYASWQANVGAYELYRTSIKNGIETEQLIQTLPDTATEFIDLDFAESDAAPGICYYIKAVENIGNIYDFQENSYSNTVCYTVAPKVTIPNAFYPEGVYNKIFRPVTSNADTIASKLIIYNRWGKMIVPETEIWKGWDGKMKNGESAPSGVYFYYVNILGIDNSRKLYTGTFTLL